MGQIEIQRRPPGFLLCHLDDVERDDLELFRSPNDAEHLAKFDDDGRYRPLKTAPNLRHGWQLELPDIPALHVALDLFYPGRLAVLAARETGCLTTTPLRETLDRQTGIYRVAAKISDPEIDALVGRFCRSRDGEPGCLRTILWPRDATGARPSMRLPDDKLIGPNRADRGDQRIPLLCQEACNLLVAEARRVVKGVTENAE
jgi:sirohydrochlorin cobaltochelatase